MCAQHTQVIIGANFIGVPRTHSPIRAAAHEKLCWEFAITVPDIIALLLC